MSDPIDNTEVWMDVATLVIPRLNVVQMVESLFKHVDRTGFKLRWVVHIDPVEAMRCDLDHCESEVRRMALLFDDSDIVVSPGAIGHPLSFFSVMERTRHPCIYVEDDKVFFEELNLKSLLETKGDYTVLECGGVQRPSTLAGFWSRRMIDLVLKHKGGWRGNVEKWCKILFNRIGRGLGLKKTMGKHVTFDNGLGTLDKFKLIRMYDKSGNAAYESGKRITFVVFGEKEPFERHDGSRRRVMCIGSCDTIYVPEGGAIDMNAIGTPLTVFISSDAKPVNSLYRRVRTNDEYFSKVDLIGCAGDPSLIAIARTDYFKWHSRGSSVPDVIMGRARMATRRERFVSFPMAVRAVGSRERRINSMATRKIIRRVWLKQQRRKGMEGGNMHDSSLKLMGALVEKYLSHLSGISVLDVGSADVNGTYRGLFTKDTWKYAGADMAAGPNVDIVVDKTWSQIQDATYDVVISGQTLEHIGMPWLWSKQLHRVCKTGGVCIVIAPWIWEERRYPIDCWRILPDGMHSLMAEWTGFEPIEISKVAQDTYFVGKK